MKKKQHIHFKSPALIVGLFFFLTHNAFTQDHTKRHNVLSFGNSYILSNHSLGLFSARINPNFQIEASKKLRFQCDMGSGNIWAPLVHTFYAKSAEDRKLISQTVWHQRDNPTLRALAQDSSSYHADAIIKTFIPSVTLPLNSRSELKFSLRTFLITEGNFPFASLISDGFIEAFHSNVKGGEDPFGRKEYGFNKANISFTDRDGNGFEFKKNDFVFSGFTVDYFWYTKPSTPLTKKLRSNIGMHLGVNTTQINPSIDIGVSQTIIKVFSLAQRSLLSVGLGTNLLRKSAIYYGKGVALTSNNYLFSFSLEPKIIKVTRKRRLYSFAWNFHYQSPYNTRKDFDETILSGERFTSHWHLGSSHLYQALETHTFVLSFYKKNTLSFYLQQDFKVNNNADLQTGISYQINLH